MQWLVSLIAGLLLCISLRAAAQQQIVDPDFQTTITKPAYKSGGPTVAIDEAHDNFHTVGGQYSPLAVLLRNDGYRVIASQVPFETKDLAGIRVFVVANARDLNAILGGDISRPAFTEHECDVLARVGSRRRIVASYCGSRSLWQCGRQSRAAIRYHDG
jgi:hypothetical protein